MSGIGLLTGGWGPTVLGGSSGGGASGTRFYFVLEADDGTPTAGQTLSTSEFQVSVNGAAFANRVGAAPTSVGSGAYYYVLDTSEAVQGVVMFKVDKTGFKPTGFPQLYQMKIDTAVTDAQNTILAGISNSESAVAADIAAAQTAINAHTDSQLATERNTINAHTDSQLATERNTIITEIDTRPTAAAIDALLSANHGAGAWGAAGLDVNTIVDAIFAELLEGSVTFGDAVRGLLSLSGGPVTDFKTNTLVFKSLDGAKTRFTVTVSKNGRLSVVVGDLT